MNARQSNILNLLNEHDKVEVATLADSLGVSQVTIRKDLIELEGEGLVKRIHGGALRANRDNIFNLLTLNHALKERIAHTASQLVEAGETVMIESGSTCALLARELASVPRDITIVTNSAFIANYIRQLPGAKVILLGGSLQLDAQVCVGPITKLAVREFYVDKLFIGSDGFDERTGFTCLDHLRAETVQAMAQRANRVIVLSDASKFQKRGVAHQFDTNQVDLLVTDNSLPEQARSYLTAQGVQLLFAPGKEA